MEVHYCDICRVRVPESDVATGLAFVSDDGTVVCAQCRRQMIAKSKETADTLQAVRVTVPRPEVIVEAPEPEVIVDAPPPKPKTPVRRPTGRFQKARRPPSAPRAEPQWQRTEAPAPGGNAILYGTVAFFIAVGVGAGLVWSYMGRADGGAGARTGTSMSTSSGKVAPEQVKAEEEARRLADEAERAYAEAQKLVREDRYREALDVAEKAVASAPPGPAERLKSLADEIRGVIAARDKARTAEEERRRAEQKQKEEEEEARRRAELRRNAETQEAERRKQQEQERKQAGYERLMNLARESEARGDFDAAIKHLGDALAIMDSDEARKEIARVTFRMHVAAGDSLRARNDLDGAITAYRKALEIKDDPKLVGEIERLERLKSYQALVRLGGSQAAARDWKAATETYLRAQELAPEARRKEIAALVASVRVGEALDEAEGHVRAERWPEAERAAQRVLRLEPRHARALEILARARRSLFPESRSNSVGMKFVLVPSGSLAMGSDDGGEDERPVHKIALRQYYVSVTEVTNAQYEAFAPDHRRQRSRQSPGDNYPVAEVTWDEAMAFCMWLSESEGETYRLPTEAEWERAARGNGGRPYPWGDEPPDGPGRYLCNLGLRARKGPGRDGYVRAAPVGSFPKGASPFGALDMAGNVAEWCLDWYDQGYYARASKSDPRGPEKGELRAVRGGSWRSGVSDVRATARSGLRPDARSATTGFRVIREAGGASEQETPGNE